MSNDPEQIRRDIERTQSNLSYDVNQLGETVRPGNVARRQAGKLSGAASGLRERVMGKAADMQSAGGDAAGRVGDTASSVQHKAKSQVNGNPLAAGLVALGVGALIGSLLPSSDREQQAATALKEKAEPLVDEAKGVARQTADNLKPQAQEAAQSVKDQATDSAQTVKDEGQSTAQDVQSSAQDAKSNVQESRGSG
jgi:ElaB/YqjD/DUF883 family membrane-anchored ribosome-binding protein